MIMLSQLVTHATRTLQEKGDMLIAIRIVTHEGECGDMNVEHVQNVFDLPCIVENKDAEPEYTIGEDY